MDLKPALDALDVTKQLWTPPRGCKDVELFLNA